VRGRAACCAQRSGPSFLFRRAQKVLDFVTRIFYKKASSEHPSWVGFGACWAPCGLPFANRRKPGWAGTIGRVQPACFRVRRRHGVSPFSSTASRHHLAFWGSKDLDKLPQVLTWAGAAALRSEWAAVSRPRPLDVAGSY